MEGEQLATLEQALAELQAKDANTQHKLDILISHIPQSENPIPSTKITSVTLKAHGLKPPLPSEFDGDRTKGMVFLNSCQVLSSEFGRRRRVTTSTDSVFTDLISNSR